MALLTAPPASPPATAQANAQDAGAAVVVQRRSPSTCELWIRNRGTRRRLSRRRVVRWPGADARPGPRRAAGLEQLHLARQGPRVRQEPGDPDRRRRADRRDHYAIDDASGAKGAAFRDSVGARRGARRCARSIRTRFPPDHPPGRDIRVPPRHAQRRRRLASDGMASQRQALSAAGRQRHNHRRDGPLQQPDGGRSGYRHRRSDPAGDRHGERGRMPTAASRPACAWSISSR